MTMLAQAAKINPKNTKIKNHVDDIVLGLEEFRMPRLTMHYSAINGAGENHIMMIMHGLYRFI